MKALVLNKPYDFSYEERRYPDCPADHVVVRVEEVCICGSDNHAMRGNMAMFTFPRVIGHEVVGTVEQVGDQVSHLRVGDRVCLMPCIPCGECRACQKGKPNACQKLHLYGVHEDGGLQEYLAAPAENWLKIPADMPSENLCMLEPLTIGAHAVAKLALEPCDRVLILGSGPIGASCAVNARTYGAQVVMADTSPQRRAFAAERFRAETVDPLSVDYEERLLQLTDGQMFDAVIDTTAVKASMENAWKWIAHGGKIVFVGICNGTLEINGQGFHAKEPSLFVTRNSTRKDYERVLQFWKLGMLDPSGFVTHKVDFSQASQTLLQWLDPSQGVFKGVVTFPR